MERKIDESNKLYQTMPVSLPSISTQSSLELSEDNTHTQSLSAQSSIETTDSFTSEETGSLTDSACLDSTAATHGSNNSQGNNGEVEMLDANAELANMDKFPSLEKNLNRSMSGPDCLERHWDQSVKSEALVPNIPESLYDSDTVEESCLGLYNQAEDDTDAVVRRPVKTGSTAIRRRPGKRRSRTKLKRRCSINGHFYNRETSFFTPPHGSQMSVWVTSLVNTQEVINLLLEKYKVDSRPTNFALFVVRDNGGKCVILLYLKQNLLQFTVLVIIILGKNYNNTILFKICLPQENFKE